MKPDILITVRIIEYDWYGVYPMTVEIEAMNINESQPDTYEAR